MVGELREEDHSRNLPLDWFRSLAVRSLSLLQGKHLNYECLEFFQALGVPCFARHQMLDAPFLLALLDVSLSVNLHDKAAFGRQRRLIARH